MDYELSADEVGGSVLGEGVAVNLWSATEGVLHWLINSTEAIAKCRHLKRGFAAGVYQSLLTVDTVSHVFSTPLCELLPP
jgi:hypothetical protein